MTEKVLDRVIIDPEIMHGKPIIEGTRTPVEVILKTLAAGESVEKVQEEYGLDREDVLAVLKYAASMVSGEEYRTLEA